MINIFYQRGYNEKNRMLILDLEKSMPSNEGLNYSGYLFPQIQYEEMRDEIDEYSIQQDPYMFCRGTDVVFISAGTCREYS